jgi:hypothetical protein
MCQIPEFSFYIDLRLVLRLFIAVDVKSGFRLQPIETIGRGGAI